MPIVDLIKLKVSVWFVGVKEKPAPPIRIPTSDGAFCALSGSIEGQSPLRQQSLQSHVTLAGHPDFGVLNYGL